MHSRQASRCRHHGIRSSRLFSAFMYLSCLVLVTCAPLAVVHADFWKKVEDIGKTVAEKGEEAIKKVGDEESEPPSKSAPPQTAPQQEKSASSHAAAPAPPAGEPQVNRQFVVEGVQLGMSKGQMAKVLLPAGYQEMIPGTSATFRRPAPGSKALDVVTVKYGAPGGAYVDAANTINVTINKESVDWQQRRREATTRFGPPDFCQGLETRFPSCTWTRRVQQKQWLKITFENNRDSYVVSYGEAPPPSGHSNTMLPQSLIRRPDGGQAAETDGNEAGEPVSDARDQPDAANRGANLDPLASGALAIGMPLKEARSLLGSYGLREEGETCEFRKDQLSVTIRTEPQSRTGHMSTECADGKPLRYILYQGLRVDTPLTAFAKRAGQRFGKPPQCVALRDDYVQVCAWRSPPGMPLVAFADFRGEKTSLALRLNGIEGPNAPPAAGGNAYVPVSAPEQSADGADSARPDAVASRTDRLDIEGVLLGMTGAEVADVLRPKGWVSDLDSMSDKKRAFWESKGGLPPPQGFRLGSGPGSPAGIDLRYAYPPGVAAADRPVIEIDYFPVPSPKGDVAATDAAVQAIFETYVARHGKPADCKASSRWPNNSCTWTQRVDGRDEVLHWQRGIGGRPALTLKSGT